MKNSYQLRLTFSLLFLVLFTFCSDDDDIQYQLTTQVFPEESGTVAPQSALYNKGEEVQLKATPGIHYVFKNWSGDAAGDENPMSVVMTDDMVVTANFEKKTYALTVEIEGQGTVKEEIVQAKSTDYPALTQVQLTATPDEGWEFFGWISNESDYISENPTVVSINGPKSVTAFFVQLNYALTVEIEGEGEVKQEVLKDKTTTEYPSGTTVQLTAIPKEEWGFIKWTGDYESDKNPAILTITRPKSVTAVFELLEKVFVPDDKFEQALIDLGLDDNLDDYVYANYIRDLEELNLEGLGIQDLTGIEAFDNLKELVVSNNNLIHLDISQNGWLESLYCNQNQLTNLDISANLILDPGRFLATENQLTCIKISPIQLKSGSWIGPGAFAAALAVDNGVIYSVDCSVSETDKTHVPDNNFEQVLIDLGLDDVLDDYVTTRNILIVSELDVSGQDISDLTGIEDFKGLMNLNASNNNLTNLDISECGVFFLIDLRNNPLSCVQINENQQRAFQGLGFIFVDEGVAISLDCSVYYQDKTYVPDDNFEQALIDLGLDDVIDDYVKTQQIIDVQILDISGKNISDLTGLEDFISLQNLNCSNNDISDVSSLERLDRIVILDLSRNNISSIPRKFGIDWGSFPPFVDGKLDLSDNNLNELDISELNFFTYLDVRSNPLTCIQVNENQLEFYNGPNSNAQTDDGVIFSLDCVN